MALSLAYAHGIIVIPFNGLHSPPGPNPPETARWKHTEEWEWGDSALKPWRKKERRGNNKHGRQNDNDWNQWNDSEEADFPPPLSHKCALTEMETRQVLPGSIHTHMTFPSESQTTVWKKSRFAFEKEKWNVIKTKNSEVVLINLFYIKVYKTWINKRLDLSLTVCHALRSSSCLCSSNSAPLSI